MTVDPMSNRLIRYMNQNPKNPFGGMIYHLGVALVVVVGVVQDDHRVSPGWGIGITDHGSKRILSNSSTGQNAKDDSTFRAV